MVNLAWHYGGTEYSLKSKHCPVPFYRPAVENHCFGARYNSDSVHASNIVHYVAKYMDKDSSFQKKIDARMRYLVKKKYPDSLPFCSVVRDYYKYLRKIVNQFSRVSHHFGDYYLTKVSLTDVLNTGMQSMPSRDDIVKHSPLCSYYKRKLFQQQVRVNGKLRWQWTPLGEHFKTLRDFHSLELLRLKYQSWYNSLFNNQRAEVNTMLDGRSFTDFALYLRFYQGRIAPPIADPDVYYMQSSAFDYDSGFNSYLTSTARRLFGRHFVDSVPDSPSYYQEGLPYRYPIYKPFIRPLRVKIRAHGLTKTWLRSLVLPDSRLSYRTDNVHTTNEWHCFGKKHDIRSMSPELFSRIYVIDQNSSSAWRNFDDLFSYYYQFQFSTADQKQEYHDYKQEVQKRLKENGI